MHDSPILSALSAPADPIRRKILLVGDTGCAIACLAGAWTSSKHSNPFPAASVTPEVRKKAINIKGRQIDLDVWEIKPTHLLGRLLPHSPTTTHMLLICVATNRPSQFRNTALMWSAEAREHLPGVPTILVGCRKYPSPIKTKSEYERWMKLQNLALLSSRDGDSMAASIDALAYFEISSIESQVSSDLFDFVGEYMLRHTTE
ncbi:hypothetical protein COCMIDRAFT_86802 [Bipolaris oryzae ATCC 44560]|uniref:Uncharacterized protein n=1 Tax=Bipolaris oryzae ATCC 44560 TaxID=930090 RepID=W6ZM62_COCMI|nr:uncharacterized protein COCMIDRAFT_86802 [Bipolaris oryzae ATCC 44560]EUC48639.1 hypothetical protein COCMIDRAFT_86802 [Bipolaris oryzae ATCC 44560]